MGILYVQGKLSHPLKLSLQHKLCFLVDPGAFFSVAPREILSMLKVSPIREETVQSADGRKAQWKVGEVRLEVDGRAVTTLVLLARRELNRCLGRTALKASGSPWIL